MINHIIKNPTDESGLISSVSELKKIGIYLWSKKYTMITACLLGGSLGLTISFIKRPKYTADISFVVQEKEKNISGGLAGIASQFGLNLGGSSNVFDGDNMIKLLPSQRIIEETLLTPVYDLKEKKNLSSILYSIYRHEKRFL